MRRLYLRMICIVIVTIMVTLCYYYYAGSVGKTKYTELTPLTATDNKHSALDNLILHPNNGLEEYNYQEVYTYRHYVNVDNAVMKYNPQVGQFCIEEMHKSWPRVCINKYDIMLAYRVVIDNYWQTLIVIIDREGNIINMAAIVGEVYALAAHDDMFIIVTYSQIVVLVKWSDYNVISCIYVSDFVGHRHKVYDDIQGNIYIDCSDNATLFIIEIASDEIRVRAVFCRSRTYDDYVDEFGGTGMEALFKADEFYESFVRANNGKIVIAGYDYMLICDNETGELNRLEYYDIDMNPGATNLNGRIRSSVTKWHIRFFRPASVINCLVARMGIIDVIPGYADGKMLIEYSGSMTKDHQGKCLLLDINTREVECIEMKSGIKPLPYDWIPPIFSKKVRYMTSGSWYVRPYDESIGTIYFDKMGDGWTYETKSRIDMCLWEYYCYCNMIICASDVSIVTFEVTGKYDVIECQIETAKIFDQVNDWLRK